MKKIAILPALLVLAAFADPLPPEVWKVEYPKQLETVKARPKSGFRKDATENVSGVLKFATAHWGEWDLEKELDKLVELALPKLEKAGDIRMGRPAVRMLYESPTATVAVRLQAARYLALGLLDARRDFEGAERLYLPLQRECETNLTARALADVVAARAHLWVLRDDRKRAIDVLEAARGTPGDERFKTALDGQIDEKIAAVHLAFYDYRAALDFNLKRGHRKQAFKLLREGKIADPELAERLAREIIEEGTDCYDAWTWLWGRDEAYCRKTLPNVLGKTARSTNLVVNALESMVGSNWPPQLPHPSFQNDHPKTIRTWEFYLELLGRLGRHPTAAAAQYATVAFAATGDRAKATAAADRALDNEKLKPEERYELELMKCVLALGGGEEAVERAIAKADAELAKECPAKMRTARFERAASLAVILRDDAVARGVARYYKRHYNALPPKRIYTVGFTATPITGVSDFDRLAKAAPESAFTRSYGGSTEFLETDVTSGERSVGGKGEASVSVRIVADAWGLHILQTLHTANARQIEAGAADGGSYECYLATPGEPHRMFMCYPRRAKSASSLNLNYDKPGFRRADENDPEMFRSGVSFGDDRIENYVAYSWSAFADCLPEDGTVWDFESLYWGSPSCAWNGTESIHGRSTFGQLRFAFDEKARLAILRPRLFAAVRDYKAEKSPQTGGVLDHWADAVTGDPAFYAKCLKPLVDELDGVAARIKSDMADDEVREIAANHLARFHNLRFEIAALRERYLTDELLPEVAPSEAYLAEARRLYRLPEYAACTNSIVTRYKLPKGVRDDWPTPGGRIGWVKVEGMHNVRDIGGWNGLGTGRVYRGGEPDCLGSCDPGNGPLSHYTIQLEGLKTMREKLGIRTDLDLRKARECPDPDRSALGVSLVRAPVRGYMEMFDKVNEKAWADAIRVFSDARNYPVYFHCWGGADRTGTLALLLQGLCGVPEADLHIDYELTTFAGFLRARDPKGPAGDQYVNMLKRLKTYPGSAFKDKIASFLKTKFGITDAEIAAIRSNLTAVAAADAKVPRHVLDLTVSAHNPRNGEGDFIRLKDGRILFVYTEYNGASSNDDGAAHLVKRLSSDEGETWTAPVEAVPRSGKQNDMSVSLLRMRDGRIALFYLRKNSPTDCRPIARYSSDEGETWGGIVETLPPESDGYYVLNNARAERLGSGRIILPVARHSSTNRLGGSYGFLACVYSDDEGKTWTKGREHLPLDADGQPVVAQEPGVVELKDGRVYLYARTDRGRQWQAFSSDGGVTFTGFGPSPIYGPLGPATIRRMADGRLLLVWNDHEGHPEYTKMTVGWCKGVRAPLTIAFSSDEGKTWTDRRTVEPEVEKGFFCYFATLVVKDGLLLHYYDKPHLIDSCVTKVPLEWIGGSKDAMK